VGKTQRETYDWISAPSRWSSNAEASHTKLEELGAITISGPSKDEQPKFL